MHIAQIQNNKRHSEITGQDRVALENSGYDTDYQPLDAGNEPKNPLPYITHEVEVEYGEELDLTDFYGED